MSTEIRVDGVTKHGRLALIAQSNAGVILIFLALAGMFVATLDYCGYVPSLPALLLNYVIGAIAIGEILFVIHVYIIVPADPGHMTIEPLEANVVEAGEEGNSGER